MSKTVDIEIDGTTYKVRRFTVGQLEDIAQMGRTMSADLQTEGGPTEEQVAYGFRIFEMAMLRADPPVENPKDLAMSQQEFKDAIAKIMQHSGLQGSVTPTGEAKPATAAT